MTTRTRYPVKCSCGHTGAIKMSENDAPYSTQYESYTLENLGGQGFDVERTFASWNEVFQNMKPTCPSCGASLTEANLE